MSIKDVESEIIGALARAKRPMARQELLKACASAEDAQQVSIALNNLKNAGRVGKSGSGLWELATPGDETPEPAPEPATEPQQPAAAKPAARASAKVATPIEVPRFGGERQDDGDSGRLAALLGRPHATTARGIQDATRKAKCVRAIADWPALAPDVAEYLREIAADIEAAA